MIINAPKNCSKLATEEAEGKQVSSFNSRFSVFCEATETVAELKLPKTQGFITTARHQETTVV